MLYPSRCTLKALPPDVGAHPFKSCSLTFGSPAAASNVGNQSKPETISLDHTSALMCPGQRTTAGTRNAPSQFESFSLRKGVIAASGQLNMFGPLSVV